MGERRTSPVVWIIIGAMLATLIGGYWYLRRARRTRASIKIGPVEFKYDGPAPKLPALELAPGRKAPKAPTPPKKFGLQKCPDCNEWHTFTGETECPLRKRAPR